MSERRRPTIVDVAALAGVSRSLASRALRGETGVAAANRVRIEAAARTLGYRTNPWGRGLRAGSTGLVGIVVSDLGNPYHTDVAAGVEDAAEEAGLSVTMTHGRRDAARVARQLEQLVALGADGVVVITSGVPPDALEEHGRQLPLVVVGRLPIHVAGVDAVSNDDEAGTRLAVDHLVDRGHRRIVHLSASTRTAAMQRRRAYQERMRERGLGGLADVIPPDSAQDGRRTLLARIRRGDPDAPTAVFASNDLGASILLDVAAGVGVAVPEQLSVVGYDNSTLATRVRPRLTTVDQPRDTMGRLALRLLIERLGGRTDDRRATLPPTLIVRQSTAPAPR